MHIIFYPLMLCSWNFADCYFPVLCSHSTRKLQIWRHYRKKYSKSKKKSMLQKIFVLSNILSYYSLVLWKNVCYCSRKLLLWPNILPEIIYSNKVLVKTRWSSTVWKLLRAPSEDYYKSTEKHMLLDLQFLRANLIFLLKNAYNDSK